MSKINIYSVRYKYLYTVMYSLHVLLVVEAAKEVLHTSYLFSPDSGTQTRSQLDTMLCLCCKESQPTGPV